MPKVVTEVYDGTFGQKHRIIAQYKETYRPIFWFQVDEDGSIYCGPCKTIEPTSKIFTGTAQKDNLGVLNFNMDDIENAGKQIDPQTVKSAKISFHGSGVINTIDDRVYRRPIRNVTEQEEICIVFFAHPEKYDEISIARKTDIPLRVWLDDEYPLALHVTVAQPQHVKLENYPSERNDTVNMIFNFNGVAETDSLTIQLSFGMPSKGNWPKYTLITFPSTEKRENGC